MDDNAEQGIALSHTKAAQNKLDHAKGFNRQHDWSISHLDERIFGMFIMLIVVILVTVWVFEVPPLIRYAVTIGAGSIFVYCKSMATKRKKDLDYLRQQQVKEHSRKDLGRINQRD
jgi:cobalamin biosynthesis protein CobD/CbiB